MELRSTRSLHLNRANLKHIFSTGRPDLVIFSFFLQGAVAVGRILLVLATISVLTTPLTQEIWTWDHFLRGGQDFETGILTIVIILCLAVLLSQICKKRADLLLRLRRMLDFPFNRSSLRGIFSVGALFCFEIEQVIGAPINSYSFPLKI